MTQRRNPITRRGFLAASGAVTAGLALASCATTAVYRTAVEEGLARIEVARFPELAEPGGAVFLSPEGFEGRVLLVNLDGANFRALSAVCTHLSCTVRYAGRFLQCPCHGSTYNLEGRVTRGPAQRALRAFETRASGGWVEIVLST